jgi:hypothetical protein
VAHRHHRLRGGCERGIEVATEERLQATADQSDFSVLSDRLPRCAMRSQLRRSSSPRRSTTRSICRCLAPVPRQRGPDRRRRSGAGRWRRWPHASGQLPTCSGSRSPGRSTSAMSTPSSARRSKRSGSRGSRRPKVVLRIPS